MAGGTTKNILVRYEIIIFNIKDLTDLRIDNVSDCNLELIMPQLLHRALYYYSFCEILDPVLNHTSSKI